MPRRTKQLATRQPLTPISYHLPGSFGVALQGNQEVAGGLGRRKQPSCFCTKKASIIFSGYLSNLDELVDELHRSISNLSSSYDSDVGTELLGSGDQALLAAETVLRMFLNSSDPDSLPALLSELQGQFSFIVFDSSKRRLFAARDASGAEPLYINTEEDGGMAFTNTPTSPLAMGTETWQEMKQQQQFALTPRELRLREQSESLEELSISPPSHGKNSIAISIRELFGKEEDHSPESIQSSMDREFQTDRLFRMSV